MVRNGYVCRRSNECERRLRRLTAVALAILVAVVALLGPARVARAGEEWCENDPPVAITTPRGNRVVVYVTSGALGLEHLPAVQLAAIRHTVQSVEGGRATLVKLDVVVPNDAFGSGFPTRSTVSSGPLKTMSIYASATGTSGSPMRLEFKLDVP
jgi:hypothetical protein